MRGTLQLGLLLLLSAATLPAQRGLLRDENDWYPLGGIEARGLVVGEDDDQGIVVKEFLEGGINAGGELKVGDVIVKAGGKRIDGKTDDEVIAKFCELVEKYESKKARRNETFVSMKLIVLRDGKKEKVEIKVRPMPKINERNIEKCEKTALVLKEALEFLAQDQQKSGAPGHVSNMNHAVATASLSGLAWLGSGNEDYAINIDRAARYVMKNAGKERSFGSRSGQANWNQTNWALGYGSIFIAEYIAAKREDSPLTKVARTTSQGEGDEEEEEIDEEPLDPMESLTRMIRKLEENQEKSGGWAHGPGGPNALGYLELQIMSNFALAGMGMAQRLGLELDAGKVAKGYQWVKACTSGGGVAYSNRPGQAGAGDPGRTAGAFWSLIQLGRKGDLTAGMFKFYRRSLEDLYEGHACPTMHVLNGALASAIEGERTFSKYWKVWRPFLMASRMKDGAFGYRPNQESRQMKHHADRSWGPAFVTAHYAIVMQLAQGRFRLLDRPRND